MIGTIALAAQLAIVAHAPDTVAACEAFEVSVAVTTVGSAPPYVIPPTFGPFDILRSSPTPMMSGSSGMRVAEFRYVLTTERPGRYTLGPFEARSGGVLVRSRPISIVVRPTPSASRVPMVVARARVDTSLQVNFRALAMPETVFVGQQANYEVAVFLNETVRDRLRRNPTFFPPDMQSMLAYDIPAALGEPPRRKVGSRCFDALVYQRALFPLLPGRFVIPPAQLVYSLPLGSGFFSREETHELRTDSTVIVALDPPAQGRPPDYNGAVGDLSITARLDTARARVGDPLVLTVRVSGTGNVKLFPRPRLQVPWASLVNGDERVQVDTMVRRIRGTKEFDWLLTPRVAGELDFPPVRYPYFNPERREYQVAVSGGRRFRVAEGSLAVADTLQSQRVMSIREDYRGPVAPPAHRQPAFWLLLAIAPLPALGLRLGRRPRRESTPTAATHLRALTRAQSAADACALRRLYVRSLAERLALPAEVFTRPGALARALRRAGVSTKVASDAERFLRTLDEAAYSATGKLPADAGRRALELYRAADAEALPSAELRLAPILVVLVAVALSAATAVAAVQLSPRSSFADGVAQYHDGHHAVARDFFLRSARAEPLAPDAWANAGTAAWAAGDTATAVVGWQRALRLEPLAQDVRERLDQFRPTVLGSTGFVAPIPPSYVAWLAVALWSFAWLLEALRVLRRRPARRSTAAIGVGAAVLALVAIDLTDRLDGRQLQVLRRPVPIAALPALGAEAAGTGETGEVARVLRREGAWTRIALDGGREGWVASGNLVPLSGSDAPAN